MKQSAPQLAASRTRESGKQLVALARATNPDKLNWTPAEKARPAMDQLRECVIANRKWTAILRTKTYANLGPGIWDVIEAECPDIDTVCASIASSCEELAKTIEAIPEDITGDAIETEWGPYSIGDCMLHACWNMNYHEGQINYIQTLYGDFDEH